MPWPDPRGLRAFLNFEGKRSLSLLALFGLFLGGHGNR